MTKSDVIADNGQPGRRRANGWPVLPLRIFLAALFLFAGYAKLAYPHFFDPRSPGGFKSSIDSARSGTPLGGILGPLSDHASVFGHITAFAEIAIGLGLLVGLLTRIAAAGGMVLVGTIVLSVDWAGVKQYTGTSGWFTSVDLAVAAALSVYLLGGADPFSLDALIWKARLRRRDRDDAEPGFRDNELSESRARLQGDYPPSGPATERLAPADPATQRLASADPATQRLAPTDPATQRLAPADPEPDSLWNEGRRDGGDEQRTAQFERVSDADRPAR